jgi:hypothetical protein
MAWVDKNTVDYLHIWYQNWYSQRYANDLIKPDFLTGLMAARAAVKEFNVQKPSEVQKLTDIKPGKIFLSDRADGAKGHFCIARINKENNCTEYYNNGKWTAFCEVFTEEEVCSAILEKCNSKSTRPEIPCDSCKTLSVAFDCDHCENYNCYVPKEDNEQ